MTRKTPRPHDAHAKLREHLDEMLTGGSAHVSFEEAIADLPARLRGKRPEGQSHTPWRLLEHMRLAQHEIVAYTTRSDWDADSPPWPEGFWPEGERPSSAKVWQRSIESFRADLAAMLAIVHDPDTDLLEPMPWATGGHTPARQAMLLADHNSYHIGQLVTIRRLLGAWEA